MQGEQMRRKEKLDKNWLFIGVILGLWQNQPETKDIRSYYHT